MTVSQLSKITLLSLPFLSPGSVSHEHRLFKLMSTTAALFTLPPNRSLQKQQAEILHKTLVDLQRVLKKDFKFNFTLRERLMTSVWSVYIEHTYTWLS
ncbi:hypothetical protein L596_021624 [Steinernema carpocapsae]|uniref:Uncharacterized protein n=1 Tax=Steinernema carpocapsae TaxID=34508 RepID=A0A4U5MJA9_STECR|nr:hypothetical protein L596_021624 [Steinernema carpocapsae]